MVQVVEAVEVVDEAMGDVRVVTVIFETDLMSVREIVVGKETPDVVFVDVAKTVVLGDVAIEVVLVDGAVETEREVEGAVVVVVVEVEVVEGTGRLAAACS